MKNAAKQRTTTSTRVGFCRVLRGLEGRLRLVRRVIFCTWETNQILTCIPITRYNVDDNHQGTGIVLGMGQGGALWKHRFPHDHNVHVYTVWRCTVYACKCEDTIHSRHKYEVIRVYKALASEPSAHLVSSAQPSMYNVINCDTIIYRAAIELASWGLAQAHPSISGNKVWC